MSYQAINDIASLFGAIFGNGIILAMVIILFFLIGLVLMRVHIGVIAIVLLPLVFGFAFYATNLSGMINLPAWIYFIVLAIMGAIMAAFFAYFMFR